MLCTQTWKLGQYQLILFIIFYLWCDGSNLFNFYLAVKSNPYVIDREIIIISWTHICFLAILFLRLQSPLEIYFYDHISIFSLVCKFWILSNRMDQSTIVQKQDTWTSKWNRASMHNKYDNLISIIFLNYTISTKWADSKPSEFQKTLYIWKYLFH